MTTDGKPPIVFATLAEQATHDELLGCDNALRETMNTVAVNMTKYIEGALTRAYIDGLRDGFQQGVQAECAAAASRTKDQPPEEPS